MSDRQIAKVKAGSPVAALVPTNIEEAFRISQAIAMSHMAPMIGSKNNRRPMGPEEIMATIMAGMEVGMKPMASLRAIALINGRPAFWGDGQLALIQSREDYGGMAESVEDGLATCTVWRVLPIGETVETTRTFSMEQAKRANLLGKPGPWQEYPERMLAHRARGFALRDAYADALMGILSEAEAYDTPPDPDDLPMIEGDIVKDSPDDPTPYEEVDDYIESIPHGTGATFKEEEEKASGGQGDSTEAVKSKSVGVDDSSQKPDAISRAGQRIRQDDVRTKGIENVQADRPDGDSEVAGEVEREDDEPGAAHDGNEFAEPEAESETERDSADAKEITPAKLAYLVKSVHGGLYDKKTKKAVDNFYITNYKEQVEALPEVAQSIVDDVYFAHLARVHNEVTPEDAANTTKEAIRRAQSWATG